MTSTLVVGRSTPPALEIHHVGMGRPLEWLRLGWDDLRTIGAPGLAHGALIAVLGAVLLMLGSTHFYVTAAAVTGYLLVGPIMATGVIELARRLTAHESLGFDESLQPLTRNAGGLLYFAGMLALVALMWFAASAIVLQSVLGAERPTLADTLWGGSVLLTHPQLLGYLASGALLALVVFVLSAVAVPLIIDRHATATEAIGASVRAVLYSLPAMLVWAALIVALTALGFATLLAGMVIVMPWLGYASWHAYRDLVG